ncbi:phenylacetate--CoA ligase, partial [Saccharopolyspora kobensis]
VVVVVGAFGVFAPQLLFGVLRGAGRGPELRIGVEPRDPQDDTEALERDLTATLHARLGLGCIVRVLPRDHIPRSETGKARRLVRWDYGVVPLPGLE